MSMLTFAAKRIVAIVIILFILVTVVFVLFRAVPTDPAAMVISPRMTPELESILRERFGLDKPIGEQYIIYLGNLLRRDFGISFYWQGEEVYEILKERLLPTALLAGVALIIVIIFDLIAEAVLLKESAVVNTLFYLIPFLFLGLILIYIFSWKLDVFPIGGMRTPEVWELETSAFSRIIDVLYHLVLPLGVMIIWVVVGFVPLVKATSRGVITEQKALLPAGLGTLVAASVLFYGSMATESIFSWPGFHGLFVQATLNYDYPLVLGTIVAGVAFSLVVTVCVEVFYAFMASVRS